MTALLMLLTVAGCGNRPPQAPQEYDALMNYLFRYMEDDSGQVSKGLVQLQGWLNDPSRRTRALTGFSVNRLDQGAIDAIGSKTRVGSDFEGISVVTTSTHALEQIGLLLTSPEYAKVVADDYDRYEIQFEQDPVCFVTHHCSELQGTVRAESKWGGLVAMKFDYVIQFHWVPVGAGWGLLHRFWLTKRAEGNCCGVAMNANYYLGLGLEVDDGVFRVQTNWFDVDEGAFGVFVGNPADRVVGQMKSEAKRADDWLSSHRATATEK